MATRKTPELSFEERMKLRESRFSDHLAAPRPSAVASESASQSLRTVQARVPAKRQRADGVAKRARETPLLPLPGETSGQRMRRVLLSGHDLGKRPKPSPDPKPTPAPAPKPTPTGEAQAAAAETVNAVEGSTPVAPQPRKVGPAAVDVKPEQDSSPAVAPVPTRVGKEEYEARGFVAKSITMKVHILRMLLIIIAYLLPSMLPGEVSVGAVRRRRAGGELLCEVPESGWINGKGQAGVGKDGATQTHVK